MAKKDKKVDAYIAKSADFAKPILKYFRELVHQSNPEMEEKIKWGFPHFDYKGMCCSIAAFKEHCAISFWKASLMNDPKEILTISRADAASMGHLGKIKTHSDLPSGKTLTAYIREAIRLNEEGISVPKKAKAPAKEVPPTPPFALALKKNKKAWAAFHKFSLSQRNEYTTWVGEAKTEKTSQSRIETALEWLAEGKPRNWKYMK